MATVPPGRLTRQQIRDLALRKVGNTNISEDAKSWLAQTLFDLYTLWNWPFLDTAAPVNLTGPTFPLPADFLQTNDDTALHVASIDGVPHASIVGERDRETFVNYSLTAGLGLPPRIWHAARGSGVGFVAPDPTGHVCAAILRYKRLPDEPSALAEPTDIPVFPWHHYLVQSVFVQALQYESDSRYAVELQVQERMLVQIRGAAMPLKSQRPDVPLDPEVFGMPFRDDDLGRW